MSKFILSTNNRYNIIQIKSSTKTILTKRTTLTRSPLRPQCTCTVRWRTGIYLRTDVLTPWCVSLICSSCLLCARSPLYSRHGGIIPGKYVYNKNNNLEWIKVMDMRKNVYNNRLFDKISKTITDYLLVIIVP